RMESLLRPRYRGLNVEGLGNAFQHSVVQDCLLGPSLASQGMLASRLAHALPFALLPHQTDDCGSSCMLVVFRHSDPSHAINDSLCQTRIDRDDCWLTAECGFDDRNPDPFPLIRCPPAGEDEKIRAIEQRHELSRRHVAGKMDMLVNTQLLRQGRKLDLLQG